MPYARYRQREVGETIQDTDERWETPETNPSLREPAFVPVPSILIRTKVEQGEIILQPITECNDRYYAKHGFGFGWVLSGDRTLPLRTLTPQQVNTLVDMVLWGDIHEVGTDKDILGRMGKQGVMPHSNDAEADTRLHIAACIVYLSNHLAQDIPILRDEP